MLIPAAELAAVWHSDKWHRGGCETSPFLLHYICS
jgi:hypothetical protein